MRRDPYSDVMGEYGSSDSHLSEQLEKQLASIEDEEELKEIIREARKMLKSERNWSRTMSIDKDI